MRAGSFPGDLKNDFALGYLRQAKKFKAMQVAHVLSLGTRCLVADVLRDIGLRRFSCPFVWLFSSTEMVRHVLENDFRDFLDKSRISRSGLRGFNHKVYGHMLGREIVYLHQNRKANGGADQLRRVQRFRAVVSGAGLILFALCIVVETERALQFVKSSTEKEREARLFQTLGTLVVNKSELAIVHVVCCSCSRAAKGTDPIVKFVRKQANMQAKGTVSIHELRCVGSCTSLRLKRKQDTRMLGEILKGKRCFDLQADPLIAEPSAPAPRIGKTHSPHTQPPHAAHTHNPHTQPRHTAHTHSPHRRLGCN